MILGITGGTGCGKTTLLELIREQGGSVLDCDAIYHRLLTTDTAMLDALKARFPEAFSGGGFDRKRLGSIVFSDPEALLALNAITHTAVRQEVIRLLADGPELAAIDAIGLFEGDLAQLCDITVAITAPREARIARLMARDGIDRSYAEKRIDAQHTESWFESRCDVTLRNDGSREHFREICLAFLQNKGIIKA